MKLGRDGPMRRLAVTCAKLLIMASLCLLIEACAITPVLRPEIPSSLVPEKIHAKVALLIPESSRTLSQINLLPTGCIGGNFTPVTYGEAFGTIVREALTRIYDEVSAAQNPTEARSQDAIFEASLDQISAKLGCLISPEHYYVVTGSLRVLDRNGKEIWRSQQTSKKSNTELPKYMTMGQAEIGEGNTISSTMVSLVTDWVQELTRLPLHQYVVFGSRRKDDEFLQQALASKKDGDYVRALISFKNVLKGNPQSSMAYQHAGELLLQICDWEGTVQVAEEGLKTSPKEQGLRQLLDTANRQKDIGFPVADSPQCRAQALNREGVTLARSGKVAEALGKFEEAARAAPGLLAKAHYNAGLIQEQTGKHKEALTHYIAAQQAFLLPEDEVEALSRLVALAQRAGVSVPDSADRRYRVGILRAQQKRYQEAVQEFEAALAEAPWLVDAYYNLGLVYDFTGSYQDARRAFRTYIQLAPTAPNVGTVKTKIVELEDRLGLVGAPAK